MPANTSPETMDSGVVWALFRDDDGVNFIKKLRVASR
jgi:hypothetical protein